MKKIISIMSNMFITVLVLPAVCHAIDKDVGYEVALIQDEFNQNTISISYELQLRGGTEIRAVKNIPEYICPWIPVYSYDTEAILNDDQAGLIKPLKDSGAINNSTQPCNLESKHRQRLTPHYRNINCETGSGNSNGGIGY